MAKITEMFRQSLPFILVIFLQVGYSGMDIISKVALNDGMNSYVFAVYRHALATIVLCHPSRPGKDPANDPWYLCYAGVPWLTGTSYKPEFICSRNESDNSNLCRLNDECSPSYDLRHCLDFKGIVCSGLAYYIQGLLMRERGPVFVTAFTPLNMIIVAILGALVLGEKLFVGRVVGAMVIVAGLYLVVWGKSQEHKLISSPELLHQITRVPSWSA
ncbi:WAT1-related protein At2g37450-like [Bidens hawaiensis]|uniref:WAT1-related protein At2g37450-like n=1 Tax=Bidens hawaiensis TaxID=980011 RepID=UPI00404A2A34